MFSLFPNEFVWTKNLYINFWPILKHKYLTIFFLSEKYDYGCYVGGSQRFDPYIYTNLKYSSNPVSYTHLDVYKRQN